MAELSRIADLAKAINYHRELYYNHSAPEISDIEFDALWAELTELNPTGERGLLAQPAFGGSARPAVDQATLLNGGTLYQRMTGTGIGKDEQTLDAGTLHIPLLFWFCRNPGLALPLIALQYHEVKIKVTFETQARLTTDTPTGTTFKFSDINLILL